MRYRIVTGGLISALLAASGCSSDGRAEKDDRMELTVLLDGQPIQNSYSLRELNGKSLEMRLTNNGSDTIDFPCSLIQNYGMDITYYAVNDPEDSWVASGPPPAESYPVAQLRPRDSCVTEHEIYQDALENYLHERKSIIVAIDIAVPSQPETKEWAGLGQKLRFELRP